MELVKVFKFSDKRPGFSETIELSLNFCVGFCITYLVLSNYNKISPSVHFNHASHPLSNRAPNLTKRILLLKVDFDWQERTSEQLQKRNKRKTKTIESFVHYLQQNFLIRFFLNSIVLFYSNTKVIFFMWSMMLSYYQQKILYGSKINLLFHTNLASNICMVWAQYGHFPEYWH